MGQELSAMIKIVMVKGIGGSVCNSSNCLETIAGFKVMHKLREVGCQVVGADLYFFQLQCDGRVIRRAYRYARSRTGDIFFYPISDKKIWGVMNGSGYIRLRQILQKRENAITLLPGLAAWKAINENIAQNF